MKKIRFFFVSEKLRKKSNLIYEVQTIGALQLTANAVSVMLLPRHVIYTIQSVW